MTRIEELKEEIELTEKLIELRKQLGCNQPTYIPYYVPQIVPMPVYPQYPTYTRPYIGDPIWNPVTTCGSYIS